MRTCIPSVCAPTLQAFVLRFKTSHFLGPLRFWHHVLLFFEQMPHNKGKNKTSRLFAEHSLDLEL